MRRTIPAAILLVGLGTAGVGLVHCGETTSSVGAMNGQACSPVGSMEKASDGCNACTCSQSGWACTTLACAAPDGGGDSTVGPGGVSCVYNGVSYRPGDTFASTDGCNGCTCAQSGQVACTLLACTSGPDAASSDASPDGGCVGPPPSNGCNSCFCNAGTWICGVTQCPPGDASRSDGPPMSSDAANSDASRTDAQPPPADASASDGPTLPRDASMDAPALVACGSVTCGLGEWCDTSGATPTCRCGPLGASCGAGLECCMNPFSGCGGPHCNERCLAKDDAGAAYTCP